MKKRKSGTLKSGRSGKKVKSRKQAIAIGLSEARKKGAKVPRSVRRKVSSQADQPIRKYKATLGSVEIQGGHCVPGYNGRAAVTAAENS
jgi:uncharacterized protein DUF6496